MVRYFYDMGKFTHAEKVPKKERDALWEYSELSTGLLYTRGIKTKEEARKFLEPNWRRDTFDPFGILGMEHAVERIFQAIDENEKILIYGDFDCDGIPGSVVLYDFFRKIGYANFENYIPHRHDEGYGFHAEAVREATEKEVNLIITVDVGITSVETVEEATRLGVDVIITDHHLPLEEGGKEVLPQAHTILNSKQKDDSYEDDQLSGAGVAFKLVQALLKKGKEDGRFTEIPEGWEKWLLDMAGLATVCDMVPLVNENRALAYFGLQVMRRSRRKGLMALLQKMRVAQEHITEDDLGFMVGPRINAASRIDHPLRGFELLSAEEDAKAIELANFLDGVNDRRKGLVSAMVKQAREKLEHRKLREVIVVGDPEWNPGLLGLAATKLVEDHGRPVFVWGRDGAGEIKGSCRSDASVSLVELMRAAKPGTFLQFGGHDGAGGFSVSTEQVHTLEQELSSVYRQMETDSVPEAVSVDHELTLDEVNWETHEEINRFAPFGMGNPKPQFLFRGVMIDGVRKFGKTREHLEIAFRDTKGRKIPAICFFAPEKFFDKGFVAKGEMIDLVATIEKSMYRKTPELRLRVIEIFDTQ